MVAAVSAEADPWGYGYGGYLHQQAWPSARGPGFSGTCYGCRVPTHHFLGKREAEAEPTAAADPYYGYGGLYGGYGHGYGHGYGYGYGLGYSGNYVARSPQGLRGKRSAEAHYGYGLGFYGYGSPYHYGPGIAGHPGAATSYTHRSPQGLGK